MTVEEPKIAIVEKVENSDILDEKMMNKIVQHLIENGKLMVIGLGGTGKTNTTMHIVRYLMNMLQYKAGNMIIRIGDSSNVWKLKFDKIPYVDVTKKTSIPEEEKTVLLDLGFLDNSKNVAILQNLIGEDYYFQRELMDKNHGQTPIMRIYVLEEVQNLFDSNGKSKFWLKIWSESRNYGQFFIGLAQRLSDVSTRIVERTKYMLIGSLSGDNDLAKIRRMFGKTTGANVINKIQTLQRGEFLLIDTQNTENSFKIYFPQFIQDGSPYEFESKGNGHMRVERIFL